MSDVPLYAPPSRQCLLRNQREAMRTLHEYRVTLLIRGTPVVDMKRALESVRDGVRHCRRVNSVDPNAFIRHLHSML